jgi:hypothetical protein
MKKVLIISPFFPPVNAADMHRIRQSIEFYKMNDWHAEVVTVDPVYANFATDELLLKTIPSEIKIHKVKAFSTSFTKKIGLGGIAYRSFLQYYLYVNKLLKQEHFDLVLFSTTAYPICALGRIWKQKFKIPYVIDMQDPWRSDHYLKLPKKQRPPKFWISYYLDSLLEKFSMTKVDGLVSVNDTYIDVLKNRYPSIKQIPDAVIPFAANSRDIELLKKVKIDNKFFTSNSDAFNIVYVGRGGYDMQCSNTLFLKAIKKGVAIHPEFNKIKLFYIGTSYDTNPNATQTIKPIADGLGLGDRVFEQTLRVSYFESLQLMSDSDLLFVPGSDNIGYTASKIYNYVFFGKPILTLFHSSSSVNDFMNNCMAGLALQFDKQTEEEIIEEIISYLLLHLREKKEPKINWDAFAKYTSEYQVKRQVELFNRVIKKHEGIN